MKTWPEGKINKFGWKRFLYWLARRVDNCEWPVYFPSSTYDESSILFGIQCRGTQHFFVMKKSQAEQLGRELIGLSQEPTEPIN